MSDEEAIVSPPAEPPSVGPIEAGRDCWRIERASRASIVIDADDYFRAARQAMIAAEERIMLIGWDFDARIRLCPLGAGDDGPDTLGDFILWLVERRPALQVHLLRWDMGTLKMLFRGTTLRTLIRWALHPRIHVKLDSAHPIGASHHQKIAIVDECLAFCGGIDMTVDRWDTREHRHRSPDRVGPRGRSYGPWHDATTALEGPVAKALAELARERWRYAGGEPLAAIERDADCWPETLTAQFRDVDVAIARTQPGHGEAEKADEIEHLYLALIARTERFLYAESQYFASRRIAEAIARRLGEPDGPEFVLVNPERADGWLEQEAMDTARARLYRRLKQVDVHDRLRLYHPRTSGGDAIYVHAKVMVVDDVVLRVGSSNMNNRSLRLDTECDVAIDAALPANEAARPVIRSVRDGLLGEHLGVAPEEVARITDEAGSLIAAVERLRGDGRSLQPYREPELSDLERYLADHEVLDPEGPDQMFEPIARRSLFRRLGRPFARTRR